jgi:hypothetical protein
MLEREAITDSVLKIQSVQASLRQVQDSEIPETYKIHNCLDDAHTRLRQVLKPNQSRRKP